MSVMVMSKAGDDTDQDTDLTRLTQTNESSVVSAKTPPYTPPQRRDHRRWNLVREHV